MLGDAFKLLYDDPDFFRDQFSVPMTPCPIIFVARKRHVRMQMNMEFNTFESNKYSTINHLEKRYVLIKLFDINIV